MPRFNTTEAYHLRLRINEAIASLKEETKRENLDDDRLYFEFDHDVRQSTYIITLSFWPRLNHTPRALNNKVKVKLPEVIYKPLFMQLWYPLSLGEYPVIHSVGQSDDYPHELSALTAYLPTQAEVRKWEAESN